mmetsp:Transcript_9958/g.20206  ORF Transcript_9958/g.20206 Transcript_9958/m.20206 type:complete len:609 (-) Transcript_9958:680-2506(-)|eukprot:CAMPEP_0184686194 /NCGR_PEP_ID=MMETSP0312-20130426/21577_1 /TAXON_ID=31354 /ORGANISM="Compsopogon coeruleus, Strain SAG 36.94" /LENGTH=608 /DNA_ID=CAMNT_0027141041 /DNA_START=90 /DNA_END=1916 /DNA_ORIENTATION=+
MKRRRDSVNRLRLGTTRFAAPLRRAALVRSQQDRDLEWSERLAQSSEEQEHGEVDEARQLEMIRVHERGRGGEQAASSQRGGPEMVDDDEVDKGDEEEGTEKEEAPLVRLSGVESQELNRDGEDQQVLTGEGILGAVMRSQSHTASSLPPRFQSNLMTQSQQSSGCIDCTPVDAVGTSTPVCPPSPSPKRKRKRIENLGLLDVSGPGGVNAASSSQGVNDLASQRSIDHFFADININVPQGERGSFPTLTQGRRLAQASVMRSMVALTNPFLSDMPTDQDAAIRNLITIRMRRFSLEFDSLGSLGAGSFCEVLKARNRIDGAIYAVKRTVRRLSTNSERLSALREVFALAALNPHPNILRYHGAWFEDDFETLYIQTAAYEKGNLSENSSSVRESSSRLTKLLLAIAAGLSHVHRRGMVHLDLKPENIFLCGINDFVIGDFGLSCKANGTDGSGNHGDGRYLCPVLLRSNSLDGGELSDVGSELLKAADIFALGVTMVEIALGTEMKPGGPALTDIREGIFSTGPLYGELSSRCGRQIASIISSCIDLDPSKRPSSSEIFGTVSSLHKEQRLAALELENARLRDQVDSQRQRSEELEVLLKEMVSKLG